MRKLFGRVDEAAEVLDPASEALVKSLEVQKNLGSDSFEAGPTLGELAAPFFCLFFPFALCGMCCGLGWRGLTRSSAGCGC